MTILQDLKFPVMLALASLTACSGAQGPAPANLDTELQGIATSVATATGFPATAIEATGSRNRLRLAISDAKLAVADQSEREQVARSIVAAAEPKIAACQPCAAIEAVSVAIIHSPPQDSPGAWHVEDVVDFRRGPDGKFQLHTT